MPIYEYLCAACDHEFEREQRITDSPIKTCPHCKAPKARRLISRTSFVLKGGGWYSDLYSSPTAKKDAKKEDGEKKSTEPSKESGTKDASKSSETTKSSGSSPKDSKARNAA